MHEDIDYEELETHEARTDQLEYGPVVHGMDDRDLQEEAGGIDVTQEMIENDAERADRWLTYNTGYENHGFSPAQRLTPRNVSDLSREYTIETDSNGLETNPVIVPGDPPVMYFTQNNHTVKAVNARTGDEYWSYQFSVPEDPDYFIAHRERGVAVWEDKVLWGSATAQLLAFDRRTGEKIWETNAMPEEVEEEVPYDWVGYGITHAPQVYDGKVYVGQIGGDASAPGFTFMQAFDVETGEQVWQTRMGPKDEWVGETWKHANASVWMTPAIDTETDTVFGNTGNPGPMLNGMVRPGPNQMSGGIVALDAQTGEVKWNSQLVKGDLWDYDGQFSPMLHYMDVDGETRRVVSADHKTGWTSTFDIETGQLITRSKPFAKQGGVFLNWLPRGEENAEPLWPAITGGTAWPPDTYNPRTGLKYLGAQDYVASLYFTEEWEMGPDAGVGGGFSFPDGLGDEVEQWGGVRALNPASGEIEWEYEFEDFPESAPLQYVGGVTSTAGGLVFGTSSGGNIVALDAEDGSRLWRDDTGGRIATSPVVWTDPAENKQYMSIAADDTIITYASSGYEYLISGEDSREP